MESQRDTHRHSTAQVIYVPHKDTIRLLEVYVKRSLSLNDSTTNERKTEKWVTVARRRRIRSGDASIHFDDHGKSNELTGTSSGVETPRLGTQPESHKKWKKFTKKKSSFWKGFLSFFSSKENEDKAGQEETPSETPEVFRDPSAHDSTCLPTTPGTTQRKISLKKKLPKRKRSLRKLYKQQLSEDVHPVSIIKVDSVVSVEPAYSYYEKVSEELEKIVHEAQEQDVPPLTDEELINRMTALMKKEGDAIDDKMKDDPNLSNFVQVMTYSAFQKLADAYVETEASPTVNFHTTDPTVPPTAPAVVSVEPAYSYYEKVSEELEKTVPEAQEQDVPPLTDEELVNRIIALMKEGDAIDDKLKDNPTLSNFFQGMTYSAFQKLADAYVETEASPTINLHTTDPTVPPTAPELVKLAFALNFTARIARLSRQNMHHIMVLGMRYLQDKFEYTQACTDHP